MVLCINFHGVGCAAGFIGKIDRNLTIAVHPAARTSRPVTGAVMCPKKEHMKITYYVAVSMDGFIAKEDGDVSWLDDMNIDMTETGYEDFFARVDCLVIGRNTYDFVFNYGSWPYGDKPTWVCTNRKLEILEGANIKIVQTVDDVVKGAMSKGLKHLWLVGGGKLASSFVDKGLLTHLSISEMPVKLESGMPLFAEYNLEAISTERVEILDKKDFRQKEITLRIKKAYNFCVHWAFFIATLLKRALKLMLYVNERSGLNIVTGGLSWQR